MVISVMLASYPDMKIPINYALNWPNRSKTSFANISLDKVKELSFFNTNLKNFPSFNLI